VIHSDIGSHNFLIQDDGSLVLVDFGGSKINDTIAKVGYSSRYGRPGLENEDNAIEIDDIFALGTLVYEITVGHRMYSDLTSIEVIRMVRRKKFPSLDNFDPKLRSIIEKCWFSKYQSAEEVICDLNCTVSLAN
jgi:serine/threonine protein kinase